MSSDNYEEIGYDLNLDLPTMSQIVCFISYEKAG